MQKIIKLFLASSSELEEDRKDFEIFINRLNKDFREYGVFLHLEIWEDFIDSMSKTRLQDEYNRAVKQSDIFVMLFWKKVGIFTLEEFETAFGQFKETGKPRIYTYFKDAPPDSMSSFKEEEINSLFAFKKRLKELGHFPTKYTNIEELKYQFQNQLRKIVITRESNGSDKKNFRINIPGHPDYFTGRDNLLLKLHDRLKQKKQIILVNGLGGIGKTAAAQAYVNKEEFVNDYDCLVWVTVTSGIKKDLSNLLKRNFDIVDKDLSFDEQFNLIIEAMAQIPGNNLLIIDNADKVEELIDIRATLEKTRWTILITSRANPDLYTKVSIDELEKHDAAKLFLHHYLNEGETKTDIKVNDFADKDIIFKILEKIERHTLVTELLAKTGRKKGLSLKQILEFMEHSDNIKHNDLQRVIDIGQHAEIDGRDRQSRIYNYILSIFDLESDSIDEASKKYLRYFAILPAEDILQEHIKNMFDFEDENDLEDILEKLFQEGWINKKEERQPNLSLNISFKMHALIQTIVKAKLMPSPENCGYLVDRLSEIMQDKVTLALEYLVYAQTVANGFEGMDRKIVVLSYYISEACENSGNLPFAMEYAIKAKEGFEKFEDKNNLAISYEKLGDIHKSLGQYDKALEFFELDIQLKKELYESNPKSENLKNGLAISYYKLADIYKLTGKKEYKQLYKKAINLWQELYELTKRDIYKQRIEIATAESNTNPEPKKKTKKKAKTKSKTKEQP